MQADKKGKAFHEIKRIIRQDVYKMREYKEVDYVFDIGANIGVFGTLASVLWPNAQIHAYESDRIAFQYLLANARGFNNWHCRRQALTDGRDITTSLSDINQYRDRPSEDVAVPGISFGDIIYSTTIDVTTDRYLLKIDCDGGEKHLIGNQDAEYVIRNCLHLGMEVHFKARKLLARWKLEVPSYEDYNN